MSAVAVEEQETVEPGVKLPSWLSISQLAALTGRDRRTITKLCAAADLECRDEGKRGLFYRGREAIPVIYELEAGIDEGSKALLRLRNAQAEGQELENEIKRKERLEIEAVMKVYEDVLSALAQILNSHRDKVLTQPVLEEMFEELRGIPEQLW